VITGIGPIIARSIVDFFANKDNKKIIDNLLKVIKIEKEKVVSGKLTGLRFVITGTLERMSRDEAKDKIRSAGGLIGESVSKETDYLVCGENPGSKYDKAKELGVKILDENGFLAIIN
jgi:DNA ligase (NAD+)